MRAAVVLACVALAAPRAGAEAPRRIVAFEVRGPSKVTDETAAYLSHYAIGDAITARDIPALRQAFLSSELFESVEVTLEDAPDGSGVIVVATLDDKHSWIVAPTLFVLPGNQALGFGFAENDFRGRNQKILLYGQLGTDESIFFGTFLNPSLDGTPLSYRLDLYAYQRDITEYANPVGDPTDASVARKTTSLYLGGGALVGWRFAWWLTGSLRLRGAKLAFSDAHDGDGNPVPLPEKDGWDVTFQPSLTLDARHHLFGVTWGPYAQVIFDHTIPGLDDYGYHSIYGRAYYSWRFFAEHQLELRAGGAIGTHLPLHEDFTLGGATDLRGYELNRFRGDRWWYGRAEYSVPLVKWRFFAFRAIGFWDTGGTGFHSPRTGGDRTYLPTQAAGIDRWRNDVGAGLRVYVKAIVLPLLGLDLGYGIEGHSPEVYFEVGLTDF